MDYIIILAGGKGLRMGTDIPKQFLPIGGLPVLMHTVKRFREYSKELNIILVLPKQQQEYWQALCDEYQFMENCIIADGGETRFHSIKNGLKLIPDDAQGLVGVHDGVRPFPSVEVIRNCYETARKTGSAIPVIPVVETIRHLEGQVTSYVTSFHDFCHDSAKRASTMALAAPKVQSSKFKVLLCRGMSIVWCKRRRCLISNCIRKRMRRTTVIPSPMMLRWWRAWAVR